MKHCIHCGCPLPDIKTWPHQCKGCEEHLYNSPAPVVAVTIYTQGGYILVRRGISPYKGTLAFPGGYIDYREPWRMAACREVKEETGIVLDPSGLRIRHVEITSSNFLVMFIGYDKIITTTDWAHHDITSCTNDKGEQEVLEILVSPVRPSRGEAVTLGVPCHERFWRTLQNRR